MSQGGYVTLVGFVAREPIIRKTKEGTMVTDVRVGATTRVLDKVTGEWRDGDTSYYTVNCWRRLAEHARASLHKGDPVVVKGRFRTRSYEDKTGRLRTEVEIVADTVGHDLSRGIANYFRSTHLPADAAGGQAAADGQAADGVYDEESPERAPARDILDEEAIEQFERDLAAQALSEDGLGHALGEDGLGRAVSEDEGAARALDEDDEHEEAGTPGLPRTPEASVPF